MLKDSTNPRVGGGGNQHAAQLIELVSRRTNIQLGNSLSKLLLGTVLHVHSRGIADEQSLDVEVQRRAVNEIYTPTPKKKKTDLPRSRLSHQRGEFSRLHEPRDVVQ